MKNILLGIFLILQAGCGVLPMPSSGPMQKNECNFQVKNDNVIKWKKTPISIYVHKSVDSAVYHNISHAVDMWNEEWNYYTKGGGRLFEFIGDYDSPVSPKSRQSARDAVNTVFVDESEGLLLPGEQGATFLRSSPWGGAIYDADIIVNEVDHHFYYEPDDYDYSVYTSSSKVASRGLASLAEKPSLWSRFVGMFYFVVEFFFKKPGRTPASKKTRISRNQTDFISFALHELGHVAGLMHVEESRKSVMYPVLTVGDLRRNIRDTELSSLGCVYGGESY